MYFITPSKPGIFLFVVYGNRLYGFGEKNEKLCIYHKSIFDIGEWEELCVVDTNVMKAGCCDTGLHVAAGVFEGTIWVAARDIECTRVFSINILTKRIIAYAITQKNLEDGFTQDINLCCKCLMPSIRFESILYDINYFLITPRQCKKDTEICQYILMTTADNSYGIAKGNLVSFDHDPSSSVVFNFNDKTLSVNERSVENGRIRKLLLKSSQNHRILNIPDAGIDFVWHDMTFLSGDYGNYSALTRRKNADNNTLKLFKIAFTDNDNVTFSGTTVYWSVDLDFPRFESSPFLFSYDYVIHPSCPPGKCLFKPNFIVFESSAGIVTVPLRMLSLSESAYLTLRTIPEPLLPVTEVNHSASKKKVEEKWMSLNFIKKTMGLPDNFDLK